jgi:hypothetical protein
MLLDLVLVDEMGDRGRVAVGFLAAAVDRAVHEEFDALLDRLVY